ncbi:protein prenyltransferase alpha subunit repeat-containing protein 1-B [Wyeomyia smithii]|uniref:protein prenyltransferase alpha subunit repeat-containing protein 1-B n=1 Tax=Wyeomyia smithii TaxID=174621 RepID=UPI002467C734|nr:protein prenyltransferase alpha subunit repeat-containing protein 1-B [Wyeomyia smithii]XP_055547580.1 protein prenyltransferase alpha subunit repeat-containing protein 1-B [Wyeomyia smithii]
MTSDAVDLDDDNAFCEKIINEIHAVFLKDSELTGFEIIPMPSNTNKSPVVHLEHNLGLQSWCIKYIYKYSHRLILHHKAECSKLLLGTSPVSGGLFTNSTTGSSLLQISGNTGNNSIIKYLNCAILVNPDVATFWNLRRQLFAKNRLDITKEFQFAAVVLSKKPKSNEAFAYRRWLYLFQSFDAIDWSFEIGLCEKCADKSTTNYHAWCHRQWVVMKAPHLLKFEIYKTEKFIRKHIHDYSCYNHRQFVLTKMLEGTYFDEDDDHDFSELMNYVGQLMDSTVANVDDLLRWIVPSVNREQINEIKLRSFLYCLNVAAYDLRFCEELKSLYGESKAFENHRRYMIKFIVDWCRKAPCTLTSGAKSTQSVGSQPLNKITKLDAQESAFLRAVKDGEKSRITPQHRTWCKLFLDFDIE